MRTAHSNKQLVSGLLKKGKEPAEIVQLFTDEEILELATYPFVPQPLLVYLLDEAVKTGDLTDKIQLVQGLLNYKKLFNVSFYSLIELVIQQELYAELFLPTIYEYQLPTETLELYIQALEANDGQFPMDEQKSLTQPLTDSSRSYYSSNTENKAIILTLQDKQNTMYRVLFRQENLTTQQIERIYKLGKIPAEIIVKNKNTSEIIVRELLNSNSYLFIHAVKNRNLPKDLVNESILWLEKNNLLKQRGFHLLYNKNLTGEQAKFLLNTPVKAGTYEKASLVAPFEYEFRWRKATGEVCVEIIRNLLTTEDETFVQLNHPINLIKQVLQVRKNLPLEAYLLVMENNQLSKDEKIGIYNKVPKLRKHYLKEAQKVFGYDIEIPNDWVLELLDINE